MVMSLLEIFPCTYFPGCDRY